MFGGEGVQESLDVRGILISFFGRGLHECFEVNLIYDHWVCVGIPSPALDSLLNGIGCPLKIYSPTPRR